MKRIRTMGLCLVAVFAMFALWAVSASAASPEYKVCAKGPKGSGEFSDKGCSVASPGGKYKLVEWTAAGPSASKGKKPVNILVNPVTTEKKAEGSTECKKEAGESKLVSEKSSVLTNSYSKCSSAGKTCETPGAGAGNIKTKELTSTLVPLAAGKVGILFKALSGEVLAEYNCEGLAITAKGAPIGQIEGLSAAANKKWTVKLASRGGNPNNLQEFLYIGGAGTEAEEEEASDSFEFQVCVPKLEAEFALTHAEAKAACEAAVGDGKEPASPISGFSEIGPPFNAVAPFAQNNTTANKGSVLKIV
jgi:hypothetical protein